MPPHPSGPAKPLWRIYLVFLAPMVLSNFLQSFSGTLNGIFIGQMLGTHALAAVSGMFPIFFFFISLVIGLGAGASVLIGQAWGAREPEKVKAIAGSALALGALIGIVAALLGSVFAREGMQLLGTPADVLDDATAYARVMMLLMPLLLVVILYTQLLRGVSDTVTPLQALLLSTGLGLVLTPALIKGWLGLPPMGIQSAALAGFVSQAASLGFLVWRLRRKGSVLAPDRMLLQSLRLDGKILAQVMRIGLPTGLQMVVISISELVILSLVNGHGSQATAAYGAVTQIVNYVQFPALSIAITASILGAQAIGAGRVERLGAILRTGLWMNVCVTGSLVLLGYALSHGMLGLFLTQPEVLAQAEHLLHIMLWSMLLFGFQSVVGGIMRASGVVLMPVAISIACILLVQLPVAYGLNQRFGLEGVWMAFPVTYAAMLALQTGYHQLVWRFKKIERLV
ncbi:MAG TPA: MATE family efflux transporter [Hydrogenophaga sp.]|uniref:MATE family efflux transporter n=1 Tax=Hydrogenophaga sp. TaxID=1904254 RepID=UPI0008C5CE8D|nr:MATE family efflux transporter [Hydrogenophaga sp.]MBW8471028.1 MATE family efflux transporter [Thiobacillus sp.]OGA75788.1 MAG: MATE family efflux transporter [Burkholderiales bacterium GWE1_65_30]OGA90229.1 MAG: MATE family efflux transporter [Burkholderiales bacterium GWF1_66_17]OGB24908.1 MAG: MATE family efflux transporter [Burkholderiales bacterium RIFCSPHIGHO2_02_FULL_66_10]OGB28424.1 MAG: MATE family efflux transporter [Burkholderiales bacterium RIFCSPLOWO2_02_FULL_66_35]PKO75198.1